MLIATGTVLVLLTWVGAVLVVAGLGLAPSLAVERGRADWETLRRGLWWGVLAVSILAAAVAAVLPLRSWMASLVMVGLAVAAGVGGMTVLVRRGWRGRLVWTAEAIVVLAAMAVVVGVFAVTALGPVTNYDTGLYHLGAIRYTMEFPSIPGLANLYGPLGYGNAGFTLAAMLGNGPLGAEGYRAVNGLVIVLGLLDLGARLLARRWTVGTFILLTGLTVSIAVLLPLASFWVTSPSQDSAVLIATVVASAYLSDAMTERHRWVAGAAAALALAILLVLLRPTMAAFAMAVVAAILLRAWRDRRSTDATPGRAAIAVVSGAGLLAAAATVLRDYLLSGWLLYPLSILPFDVEWRAGDPTPLREATLGFWRNSQDLWGSVEGWSWVGPWLAGLPRLWETYLLLLLAITAVLSLVVARSQGALRGRRLLVVVAPSFAASVVWWTALPPGFRFAWGPLITMFTIPIGWSLWRTSQAGERWKGAVRRGSAALAALVLVSVLTVTVLARLSWIDETVETRSEVGPAYLSFAIVPVLSPPTTVMETDSGLQVRVPTESDQCWAEYPLCSPAFAPTLRLRGQDLADGFLP